MSLPINTLLQSGKYKIVRFIASGGFGITYEAEHTLLEKHVAIKEFFVKDYCNRDDTTGTVSVGTTGRVGLVDKLRAKFLEEARNLCKLDHPGIVKVTDVFEENGTAYFVMDFIDGPSLGDIVKRQGPMPEQMAVKYILDVCSALEYVHSHHRLHLDIKPGNILVSNKGNAVLIDFGASKQYSEVDGQNNSTLLGKTPGYAPLEQLGNDVSSFMPATDIYALGATLYKLLTGVTPPGSNLLGCGARLEPLPPSTSPCVYNALMWAMQLNIKARPQTVAQFRDALLGRIPAAAASDGPTIPPHDSEATVLPRPDEHRHYTGNADGNKKKKGGGLWWLIGGLCAAVLLIFFLSKGCSDPAASETDADSLVVVEEVVLQEATDMSYTNSKGVKFTYTGEVDSNNVPNGEGTGVYAEGTYKGHYVDGLRSGKAVYDTSDGLNHFEGTYADDKYQEGRLTFDDGSYYEGTFKNNDFNTGHFYEKDGKLTESITNGK